MLGKIVGRRRCVFLVVFGRLLVYCAVMFDVVAASFWHIRMLRRQSLRLHDMPRHRRLVRLLRRMERLLICRRHQLHRHIRQRHSLPGIYYMMHSPQRILPPQKRLPDAHPRIPAHAHPERLPYAGDQYHSDEDAFPLCAEPVAASSRIESGLGVCGCGGNARSEGVGVSVLMGEFSHGEGVAVVGVVQCFAGEVGEWDAEVERDRVCGEVVVGARAAVEEEGGD